MTHLPTAEQDQHNTALLWPEGRTPSCWVVSDGKAGTENQCLGLAEALGLNPAIKRIRLKRFWQATTPYLRWGLKHALHAESDDLTPPWPDLILSSGRQSTAPAIHIRKESAGETMVVQVQDPRCDPDLFDLVIVPKHDRLRGPNVCLTHGALNRVTPEKMAEEAARIAPELAHLPQRRIAVLIGGRSKFYAIDVMQMGDLADQLAALCADGETGLMVTTSRRTGEENRAILNAKLRDLPAVVWDGEAPNPYFGYLGHAEAILVTADSVSMISEAASTGKPVHIIPLEGGSPKFDLFHEHMMTAGAARPFQGKIEQWDYAPLRDTQEIAQQIHALLIARRG